MEANKKKLPSITGMQRHYLKKLGYEFQKVKCRTKNDRSVVITIAFMNRDAIQGVSVYPDLEDIAQFELQRVFTTQVLNQNKNG